MNKMSKDIKEIKLENWKRINKLIELRTDQIKELEQENWWKVLMEDELYNFYIRKLVEIKQMDTQPSLKIELTKEQIEQLSSGFITVEEFMNHEIN